MNSLPSFWVGNLSMTFLLKPGKFPLHGERGQSVKEIPCHGVFSGRSRPSRSRETSLGVGCCRVEWWGSWDARQSPVKVLWRLISMKNWYLCYWIFTSCNQHALVQKIIIDNLPSSITTRPLLNIDLVDTWIVSVSLKWRLGTLVPQTTQVSYFTNISGDIPFSFFLLHKYWQCVTFIIIIRIYSCWWLKVEPP